MVQVILTSASKDGNHNLFFNRATLYYVTISPCHGKWKTEYKGVSQDGGIYKKVNSFPPIKYHVIRIFNWRNA